MKLHKQKKPFGYISSIPLMDKDIAEWLDKKAVSGAKKKTVIIEALREKMEGEKK